jgi:peptide chain release factor 3
MAAQRAAVEEAVPGDVVGMFDPGVFRIGDTLSSDPALVFPGMPLFPAEHFAIARVPDASYRKSFQKGLQQLAEEGAVQVFRDPVRGERDPVLGAVGKLQFDVFAFRLEHEYGVPVRLEPASFVAARWIVGDGVDPKQFAGGVGTTLVMDRDDHPVLLFKNAYWLEELPRRHPRLELAETSPAAVQA